MRVAAITWCVKVPGLQVYLFRRKFPDLEKNHMAGPKGLRMMLAPLVDGGFVEIIKTEIRFANGPSKDDPFTGGSRIYLCHCNHEDNKYNYHGAEIHVLLMDELTTFTETMYRYLRGRVRAVGINVPPEMEGMFPRILCASNPGNIGHHFVKRMFIDGHEPMEVWQTPDKEGGMTRQYVPSRLDDNPSMNEDDPDYGKRLSGLGSPELVRALKEGDWNVVTGAYFTEFEYDKHVVEPVALPKDWLRFRSYDHGTASPFSVGWWAVSDGTPFDPATGIPVNTAVNTAENMESLRNATSFPAGAIICYREWYGANERYEGLKLNVEEIARGIKLRQDQEHFTYSVADPSIFKTDGGPPIAETFARHGVSFRPGDNQRIPGWQQLRSRLVGLEKPMIYWFSTCVDSIRTLPALQHDERKPEDVDTDGEDHAGDQIRYACMSRPVTKDIQFEQPLKTEITYKDILAEYDKERLRRTKIKY